MKYLFMLVFVALVWWLWAKRQAVAGKEPEPRQKEPEKMVTCAHCGVHFPLSEGIAEGNRFYCSEAHRSANDAMER